MYRGNVKRYKAKVGQATHQQNRLACGRHLDNLEKVALLAYVDSHIREDKWSLDACIGRALQSGEFAPCELVCTKTLYRYVDLGLMGTRNHKSSREAKKEIPKLIAYAKTRKSLVAVLKNDQKKLKTVKSLGTGKQI